MAQDYQLYRDCFLTEADEDALSDMLREKFPTTFFCDVDTKNRRLILYSSLSEFDSAKCWIYVPEPGWQPEFENTAMYPNLVSLANGPSRYLCYMPRRPKEGKVSEYTDHDLPGRPLGSTLVNHRGGGSVQGNSYDDEGEAKAFLTWVFNATGRAWTNSWQVVDLETDRVIDEINGSTMWAGADAARRCAEEPNFFSMIRPDPYTYHTLIGWKAVPRAPKAARKAKR